VFGATRSRTLSQPGGPEVLTLTDRPMPVPDYDQMVAKVAYARVNRPDAQQCAGSKILQKRCQ